MTQRAKHGRMRFAFAALRRRLWATCRGNSSQTSETQRFWSRRGETMTNMANKKVLITGGASGIGRCLADNFAQAGSELIITDLNGVALQKTASELKAGGATVHSRVVDIADQDQVEAAAKWINEELGGIDILVNNAGIGHSGELADTDLETWKKLIDVNLLGTLYHVYAFLPSMIEKGSGQIVNVSSGQAFFRLPTWGPYATIKLAQGAFSEILRHEIRKYNIKVTTVYPFLVNTPFYADIEGETMMQKLSIKLMPYYSMNPNKVGKIIFKAIKKQKNIEMVTPLNDVAKYLLTLPGAATLVGTISMLLLGKK